MSTLSQAQIAGLAQSVGLPTASLQIASAIAKAESGGRTDAVNPNDPGTSVGIWQINLGSHPQYTSSQMKDPVQNAKAMALISTNGSHWNAWGAYTNGSYLAFMNPISPVPWAGSTGTVSTKTGNTSFLGLSSTVKTNPATVTDLGSGFTFILAYAILIAIFVFIAGYEAGYTALYYLAVLFLLLLLVTQSRWISFALFPLTNSQTTVTID